MLHPYFFSFLYNFVQEAVLNDLDELKEAGDEAALNKALDNLAQRVKTCDSSVTKEQARDRGIPTPLELLPVTYIFTPTKSLRKLDLNKEKREILGPQQWDGITSCYFKHCRPALVVSALLSY